MSTFVFRLNAPRPTFALDMNDEEREIMARRAASKPGTGPASASNPPLSAALPCRCRAPSAPLPAELALSRRPDLITHVNGYGVAPRSSLPNRNAYRGSMHMGG
jgi:hypothetical protein